jgi:hypothetical protein
MVHALSQWDTKNPNARRRWYTQHDGLKYHDPPYVYNVHKDDQKAFIAAVRNALENPIDRYVYLQSLVPLTYARWFFFLSWAVRHIVSRMRMTAIKERLRKILETNWKGEAELLLAERIRTKKEEVSRSFGPPLDTDPRGLLVSWLFRDSLSSVYASRPAPSDHRAHDVLVCS